MKLIRFTILLLLVNVWVLSFSLAQTSGGGPITHSPSLNITDGISSCYPYQLNVPSGSLSCSGGQSTLNVSGGTGAVNSVSNLDGTLTISPTTGSVIASLNLGSANTWTASQKWRAGTTAALTAPFYMQSGPLMTTPEVGAKEFLTDKFYGTISTGAARKEFALWDSAGTSGRIPFETTNGRLLDSNTLTFASPQLTIGSALTGTGILRLSGLNSGAVSILPQATTGIYNFNLPIAAGTSGQPLLSAGGAGSPMTFGTLGISGGGTNATNFSSNANGVVCINASGNTFVATSSGATTTVLKGGASGTPTFGAVNATTDISFSGFVNSVSQGGTGQSTPWVIGDILYGQSTTVTGVISAVATGSVLTSAGTGTKPVYSANPTVTTLTANNFRSTATQTVTNCSTSGSITSSQPNQGSNYKNVIIYCNACLGTATYTYPVAFTNTPEILSQSLGGLAVASTTSVTITGTTSTGFIEINGY